MTIHGEKEAMVVILCYKKKMAKNSLAFLEDISIILDTRIFVKIMFVLHKNAFFCIFLVY